VLPGQRPGRFPFDSWLHFLSGLVRTKTKEALDSLIFQHVRHFLEPLQTALFTNRVTISLACPVVFL
jgi:hypothetical protein